MKLRRENRVLRMGRVRVHANQRDHNRDGVDDEPVEEYLIVA